MIPPRSRWRVRRKTALPERPELEGLLEPNVDALPVRIIVVQDDFVTGWDDGAMAFERESVWFSGRTTSFRVVSGDIVLPPAGVFVPGINKTSRVLARGMCLRHPSRDVRVRVAALPCPERREWEDEDRIAREIERLTSGDARDGQSQYPPLWPRPGAIVRHVRESTTTEGLFGFTSLPPAFDFVARFFAPRNLTSEALNSPQRNDLLKKIAEEEAP